MSKSFHFTTCLFAVGDKKLYNIYKLKRKKKCSLIQNIGKEARLYYKFVNIEIWPINYNY